jgi:propanol-preferring alcohol dehydrogenase
MVLHPLLFSSMYGEDRSDKIAPATFQQYVLGPGEIRSGWGYVICMRANHRLANYVTKIPDSLDSADAAPMLCAGVTVYSALRKSGAKSGDWIALLGAGGGVSNIATNKL